MSQVRLTNKHRCLKPRMSPSPTVHTSYWLHQDISTPLQSQYAPHFPLPRPTRNEKGEKRETERQGIGRGERKRGHNENHWTSDQHAKRCSIKIQPKGNGETNRMAKNPDGAKQTCPLIKLWVWSWHRMNLLPCSRYDHEHSVHNQSIEEGI